MRVLVTGGRDYANSAAVESVLDELHNTDNPISLLIHGGATGADALAGVWARERGVRQLVFAVTPAEWASLGPKAGPLRNKRMLEESRPDLVVAFPGRDGTRSMTTLAKRAGVRILFAEHVLGGRPAYQHTCTDCVFLGRAEGHDLYFCRKDGLDVPIVIARYGSRLDEYTSGMALAQVDPILAAAKSLAVARGLVK